MPAVSRRLPEPSAGGRISRGISRVHPYYEGLPGEFMSTPSINRYKGFDINVQVMRRGGNANEPADGPRHFDIVVNLTRQIGGADAKSGIFGMPVTERFDSPMAAQRAAIAFARDLIDGKIEGESVDDL
jgi:hypothetical protein